MEPIILSLSGLLGILLFMLYIIAAALFVLAFFVLLGVTAGVVVAVLTYPILITLPTCQSVFERSSRSLGLDRWCPSGRVNYAMFAAYAISVTFYGVGVVGMFPAVSAIVWRFGPLQNVAIIGYPAVMGAAIVCAVGIASSRFDLLGEFSMRRTLVEWTTLVSVVTGAVIAAGHALLSIS